MLRAVSASLLALGLLVTAAGGAAAAEPPAPTPQRGRVIWGDSSRGYLLYAPRDGEAEAAPAPLPLVIALHGAGEDAEAFAGETGLGAAGTARGMLVAFPEGTEGEPGKRSWNAQFCCGAALAGKIDKSGVDDIGFIGALIDRIAELRPIDRSRVYATGLSNGAMLTYQLAAAHPEWLAAIAPVAGTIGGTSRDGVPYVIGTPARPVPVMILHGRKDEYVLYDGGSSPRVPYPKRSNMSVEAALHFWAAADGCAPQPEESEPEPGLLRHITYKLCAPGGAVELWQIEQGRHEWPPIAFPAPGGGTRSASAEIVAFFARHRRD